MVSMVHLIVLDKNKDDRGSMLVVELGKVIGPDDFPGTADHRI